MVEVLRSSRGRMDLLMMSLLVGIGFYVVGDRFFHVGTRTLTYHWEPMVGGQSVAVWPIFVVAAALMFCAALAVPIDLPRQQLPELLGWGGVGYLIYWSSGRVGDQHLVLFCAAACGAWLVRVATLPHRRQVAAFSVVLAVIGGVAEGLFSALGLFDYQRQDIVRVPWWLFVIYLSFGPMALVAASELRRRSRGAVVRLSLDARELNPT